MYTKYIVFVGIIICIILFSYTYLKIRYKEDLGTGTALSETPEMQRVKRNQENISMVHCGVTLSQLQIIHPYIITEKPFPKFNCSS